VALRSDYVDIEIAPGADLSLGSSSWNFEDISHRVRESVGVQIGRGRPDEHATAPPQTCRLQVDNADGDFCRTNPLGRWYGLLSTQTPLRIAARGNDLNIVDTYTRSVSDGWGTADSGEAWTTSGGAASDYSVTGSVGRHTLTSTNVARHTVLSSGLLACDITWRFQTSAVAAGAMLTTSAVAAYVDADNNIRGEVRLNTDQTITVALVERASASDSTADTGTTTLTHAANTWLRARLEVRKGFTAGGVVARIKVWGDADDEPTTWHAQALMVAAAGSVGIRTLRATGNTNTNVTIDTDDFSVIDGPVIRFTGFIDELPPRWDPTLTHQWADITASGLLRRLGQGGASRSAAYASLRALSPKAFWPMEDRSGAPSLASGIVGGLSAQFTGLTLASDSGIKGSDPLPVLTSTASMAAPVVPYPSTGEWLVVFVARVPAAPGVASNLLRWYTSGTQFLWTVDVIPGSPDRIVLKAYNGTTYAEDLGATGIDIETPDWYGTQLVIQASAVTNGSDLDWDLTVTPYSDTGSLSSVGESGTEASSTVGNPSVFGWYSTLVEGATVGLVTLFDDASTSVDLFALAAGDAGDLTTARLGRISDEYDVSVGSSGSTTTRMGPRTTGTAIAALREAEAAESGGILHDGRTGSITLQTRAGMYNQTPALELDFDAGHIKADGFNPADDDQQIRNLVEVQVTDGSRGVYADQDHIDAHGGAVWAETVTLSLNSAERPEWHASWRVWMGTQDELRIPNLTIDFHRNSDLLADWLAMEIGNRLTIDNPPPGMAPDQIDLILQGYAEVLGSHTWTVSLNTSPARPYLVNSVEDGIDADSTSSYLVAGIDESATSIQIGRTDQTEPAWNTTDEPYDIDVGGERITVTAMGAVSGGNQTATVTRSVNGVTKAHAADAQVKLWRPRALAL
jgi:hypothetical protein